MRTIRSKLTYANVISTLCLFLLLGGGAAFAATKLAKNSVGTAQLKNGAVTSAKVKSGSLLASNFAAGQLPAGPQGVKGETGKEGKEGSPGERGLEGKQGKEGNEGPEGKEGSPWTAGGKLPSGKTETGAWSLGLTGEGPGQLVSLSFPLPLTTPIEKANVHFLAAGEGGTTECPGTAENPEALSRNLCIYTVFSEKVTFEESFDFISGATLILGTEAGGFGFGAWAVTAE